MGLLIQNAKVAERVRAYFESLVSRGIPAGFRGVDVIICIEPEPNSDRY